MDPQTFIHFPRLPIELRLKIWKQACQPLSPNQRGIHYINFGHDGVAPLPCNWSQPSTEQSPRGTNNSAYLIDGGLWTACKESREVILKHTNYEDWIEIQHEAMDEGEPFRSYCRQESWPDGEEIPHPATMDLERAGQEWHMLVYPEHDIFCIRATRWKSTYKAQRKYVMSMSFARGKPLKYKPDRHKCDHTSFEWLNSIWIHNIAFEFDQSWMDDLPRDFFCLVREENSARGCWARYFIQSLDSNHLNLWIIDKNAQWSGDSDQDYDTLYRDCEGDYVEVDNEDILDDTGDGISSSVSAFLGIVCDKHDLLEWATEEKLLNSKDYREWGFEMEDYARVLVRRDNEVVPPRPGNCRKSTRCKMTGWCVCPGGEDNGCGLLWRRRMNS